jgi:hypothetical protein
MIYFQIFHQNFHFPSKQNIFEFSFENFNISDNNIISVELAWVGGPMLDSYETLGE